MTSALRFSFRPTFVILGACLLVFAAYFLFNAHLIRPIEIDGRLAAYTGTCDRSGCRSVLQLEGDSSIYVFNRDWFHPTLPYIDTVPLHREVSIWVDQGTHVIIAMRFYDSASHGQSMYTTSLYDHPGALLQAAQQDGLVAAAAGAILLLLALVWPRLQLGEQRLRSGSISPR
jgi:hypothetical protein